MGGWEEGRTEEVNERIRKKEGEEEEKNSR